MHKKFSERGFADYVYWQTQDKKTLRRINNLLNQRLQLHRQAGTVERRQIGLVERPN